MIRKLTEQDRERTLNFLKKEAAINLFIIGDIEGFGFDSEIQELWGQFDEKAGLEGVLLRFNESYIPYFEKEDFDITGFKNMIENVEGKLMLSGKATVLKPFLTAEELKTAKSDYFCELKEGSSLEPLDSTVIKIATEDDAERITELIEHISEFQGFGNTADRIAHKIKTKTGRVYYIEDESGKMISVSQTTAENSMSAMVVGVATLPEHRGKGLMSKCLSKLCRDLLEEGKTLCLFYDNPKAGSVYHRLGFESIDHWRMLTRNDKN